MISSHFRRLRPELLVDDFLGLARLLTVDQTTANQERELRQIAGHMRCEIVKVYKNHGINGAKDRPGVRVIAAEHRVSVNTKRQTARARGLVQRIAHEQSNR